MASRHEKFRREHIRNLSSFKQYDWETWGETWMRMKDMLEIYYYHGLEKQQIINIFYYGLKNDSRDSLEFESGGMFIYNSANRAFQILEEKSLLSLNRSTKDSSHSNSNPWRKNPNPCQDDLSLGSLKLKFLEFLADMNEINESWYRQLDNLKLAMHQNFENNESSIQRIGEKLRVIEMDALQSNIQPDLRTSPPASEHYSSSATLNEHMNVVTNDIAIISNNVYCSNVNNEGITNHALLVPEPVEDDFTDDEMEDEEGMLTPELVKDNFEDDKTLDGQLQELLSNDLGELVNNDYGHITSEEFDKIVEMSIDEFRQWIEEPPLGKSYDELKREDMIKTSLEEPSANLELEPLPSNLEYAFLQGESLLPLVISSLLPVMIQVISTILVLSPIVKTYNERLKKKLDKTSPILLNNKYSDYKKVVISDWVMKKVKFKCYTPFNFRPPDISSMGMPEIPLNFNEHQQYSNTQTCIGNISMENFSKEFMETNAILWNKTSLKLESLKLPCSKEDEHFNLLIPIKKSKDTVSHVLRLPKQNYIRCLLWLGNLPTDSTCNYFHPHLNSSVGESPIITCK